MSQKVPLINNAEQSGCHLKLFEMFNLQVIGCIKPNKIELAAFFSS